MSAATDLHAAVKQGNLPALRALLAEHPRLANARSETDPRGTCPLHVAAELGQAEAAKVLLEHGADGGAQGQWQQFSNASLDDWRRCVELLQVK